MSRKECGHHEAERRRVRRVILIGGSSLMVVILMAILVVFLILRPTKPQFRLEDATLYSFNLTPYTNTLSLTMQVTLSAHNPNARIAVYYHSLRLHATYRAHQISLPTALPDTYQPRRDFTIWSPFLYASALPLPPSLLDSLRRDHTLMLTLTLTGALNWKVATWVSARYHLHVNCPAFINLAGDPAAAAPLKLHLLQSCTVDV